MRRFILLLLFITGKLYAQQTGVTVSGTVRDAKTKQSIPFASLQISTREDNTFVTGTASNEAGRFTFSNLKSGSYVLHISVVGYKVRTSELVVGSLSPYLDLGNIQMEEDANLLNEVKVRGSASEGLSSRMDKKTFSVSANLSQAGGSVLQALQNLPGVTLQDGKVQLRGNDKVAVLIDGKQNSVTGFGTQTALDNLPASAIDRIEIIDNPSAKYDANGNAGIINIIYKKSSQEGFNGKVGLMTGLGALWIRKENLPGIRPQYVRTPKVNPSLQFNYRKSKLNTFFQGDWLYTQTLNRNEFAERVYDDGTVVRQQVKRNRNTDFTTIKTGVDWNKDENNTFTLSAYLNREKIIDRGDIPYFNADLSQRNRLWQFLEDEVKYTATGSLLYQHKFSQPGHLLNAGFNYTFHREDEQYFFTNIMPAYTGLDAFKLLSDEHVGDFNLDYVKPLKHGRLETGIKLRRRTIPVNMRFFPGLNSPLDTNAGGWADYKETIPAAYGNYVFESNRVELEAGLRMEYVKVNYLVNPNHNTYKSDGYDYTRPFPNLRFAYKFNERSKLAFVYSERVDRPNEVDIRIFPKYDEPEVIKVGNPALRPQFTKSLELGYKFNWVKGGFSAALFHKLTDATIARIATTVPGSTLIYNVFQNAGRSTNSGGEVILQQEMAPWVSLNLNGTLYRNTIRAFTIENKYPVATQLYVPEDRIVSGNVKLNGNFKFPGAVALQLSAVYLAPDLIPQGRVGSRFSADMGLKKSLQKGRGELFLNGTNILNTMDTRKSVRGNGFYINSTDYYETQVFRLGYNYKF